ncbi:MAG: MarR family transcriptional regulator [Campylobacteraceae bacterium]|jgi:DNA-binding MarR family transcriptional regulator|nr:MarR family transcriptional regulator [Campylobacteraceae bacterium]
MGKKDISQLFEENLLIIKKMGDAMSVPVFDDKEKTPQRVKILLSILDAGGRSLLRDIAKREDVSAASLCIMLKKLEQKGWVEREIDKEDRRNTYYILTNDGRDVANEGMEYLRYMIRTALEPIKGDDVERFADALVVINEILRKYTKT